MWLKKPRAGCSLWRSAAECDLFEGWHDGYTRLADPVMHRRRITLEKRARRIVVEDALQMSGAHEIELFFHCSERCRVDPIRDGYRLSQPGGTLSLKLPQVRGATSRIYYGSIAPISGWISRRFDDKQPAATIAWRARLAGDNVLCSEISC